MIELPAGYEAYAYLILLVSGLLCAILAGWKRRDQHLITFVGASSILFIGFMSHLASIIPIP